MDARERELLTGMGNCFEACHADFEGTVEMVANARSLSTESVVETLRGIRTRDSTDAEYRRLRGRFPADFPV